MTKNYEVKSISDLYIQADNIMQKFNFEKVHDHMKSSKWAWHDGIEEHGVPSIEQIKSTANYLLSAVISNGDEVGMNATGGLQALKFPWGLSLNFIYEHSQG